MDTTRDSFVLIQRQHRCHHSFQRHFSCYCVVPFWSWRSWVHLFVITRKKVILVLPYSLWIKLGCLFWSDPCVSDDLLSNIDHRKNVRFNHCIKKSDSALILLQEITIQHFLVCICRRKSVKWESKFWAKTTLLLLSPWVWSVRIYPNYPICKVARTQQKFHFLLLHCSFLYFLST